MTDHEKQLSNEERKRKIRERYKGVDRDALELIPAKEIVSFKEFSYDGYQVVRKELSAPLREPAITIRKDSVTFNTACINGLEDVVYIHMMFRS